MSFDAIGKAMGKDPRDAAIDLVIADKAESSVIISIMRESDVIEAMRTPWVSFDTDSGARAEDGPLSVSKSHPRAWGTFTRVLGKYVRQDGVLTLEEAVRKMTSQAAIRVGISDRGLVRPGMMADLVVFDPATVADVATFEQPNRYSVGVRHVFVNGKAVVADGAITNERPGRPLRGPGYRETIIVAFETEKGTIELEVDSARAPATAANFLRYVDGGFFDGGSVNRAVRPDNTVRHDVEIQVIQFQIDEARSRQEFPPIPLERTSVTGVETRRRHDFDGARRPRHCDRLVLHRHRRSARDGLRRPPQPGRPGVRRRSAMSCAGWTWSRRSTHRPPARPARMAPSRCRRRSRS